MMIDWTKPVQTRDGRKVRVLCTDGPGSYPIVGYVADRPFPTTWTVNGQEYAGNDPSKIDAINVPEKRVVWVNMYPAGSRANARTTHLTKKVADGVAGGEREACIRVEYEVGQYDEEPG